MWKNSFRLITCFSSFSDGKYSGKLKLSTLALLMIPCVTKIHFQSDNNPARFLEANSDFRHSHHASN
ncbi:hypothetical protein EUGRSUZ_L00975 [Eucalyptus grandis]|uniref:Uncharacterized protein n=1 Tax=Eucalyptus grandis TaxID=71139 RepID=A0A058ZVF7_EUCGR|nr:hypothetical protein EUGRSUZ_L00975 [Eucalyptus grandis]